ncbi:MAG: type II CAAX prenyl endopeptidase Rce1 family protein, partial [Candidatus Dadabacteria bacterium]
FNKIPEHFLILGILIALMLPHRRLPNPAYMAPIEGSTGKKLLRWLGIAQPVTIDSDNRILAWFGLNWTSLFAMVVSGLVFYMIHLGRANHVEVALSLPGGIMVSYITLRTHSIWHVIPAHWTLNLVPMAILHFYKF